LKNFLVIGNPIKHSLSPKLHNFWIKNHDLKAVYNKKEINNINLKDLIQELRTNKITGANVTVPFKKLVIPHLDEVSNLAKTTSSVNTIYKRGEKIVGDNTDSSGFEKALDHIDYKVAGKKIFLLGAGGVAPSIIYSLKKMKAGSITLSNRTKEKAQRIKEFFPNINIVNWGVMVDFDMIINATSLGLNNDDKLDFITDNNYKNKLFYDVIYNPKKTNFLAIGKKNGSRIENGKLMFLYQAQLAFEIWHGIKPLVDEAAIDLVTND
jgi:shikimate dehydrogenase